MSYAAEEVAAGRADWVNRDDPKQGILCRAILYSGEVLVTAAPEAVAKLARPRRCPLPSLEVELTHFDDPEKSLAKRAVRMRLIASARACAYFGRAIELVQQLEANA